MFASTRTTKCSISGSGVENIVISTQLIGSVKHLNYSEIVCGFKLVSLRTGAQINCRLTEFNFGKISFFLFSQITERIIIQLGG